MTRTHAQDSSLSLQSIADRLQGLRESLELSAENFAQQLSITPAELEDYESGTREIPVSFLMEAARIGKIDLTDLLLGAAARLHDYTVVRQGKGVGVERRKDYAYLSLASRFAGRSMEPFIVTVPPKGEAELTFTTHTGQEFIYMLEGRLELSLGSKKEVLERGDSIYFSSKIPHALRGLDGKKAVFIDVIN